MAKTATEDYGTYDRVLDWLSARRTGFAKAFVVFAVAAMVGVFLLVIVAQVTS